jgi:hypothetical protein
VPSEHAIAVPKTHDESSGSPIPVVADGRAAEDIIADARAGWWKMVKRWGTIDLWRYHIQEMLQEARDDGTVADWTEEMMGMGEIGTMALRQLMDMATARLPEDHDQMRDLFRQAHDLSTCLNEGMGHIQAWLDMVSLMSIT